LFTVDAVVKTLAATPTANQLKNLIARFTQFCQKANNSGNDNDATLYVVGFFVAVSLFLIFIMLYPSDPEYQSLLTDLAVYEFNMSRVQAVKSATIRDTQLLSSHVDQLGTCDALSITSFFQSNAFILQSFLLFGFKLTTTYRERYSRTGTCI